MHMPTMFPRRSRDLGASAPDRSLLSPSRDFDRVFDLMRSDPFTLAERLFERQPTGFGAMDVSETEDAYLAEIDVPGMKEEDIDIDLTDGTLTVRGERKSEREEEGRDFRRVERAYGSFYREIELPRDVEGAKVAARYEDGVLKITLPKSAEAKTHKKKIPIGK